jgi:flagellar motor switch protein FliM
MDKPILTKMISKRRVGRSPLSGLDDINAHLGAKMEERLRRFLKTMTGAMLLECEVRKLSRVLEDIPVPAMLGIIEVDGLETFGLVNVSSDLVYHIVDLRMGGDAAEAPAPTARSFTAIDSALCEGFVQQVIDCLAMSLDYGLGVPLPPLMTISRIEQNITQVRLAPDNADVLVITFALDIGEAARQGSFDLVLPLSVLDAFRAAARRVTPPETEAASKSFWRSHMTEAAHYAQIDAMGIMHRMQLTLSELRALEIGTILPLPATALEATELRLGTADDKLTFTDCEIGQFQGHTMLRLQKDPDPRIVDSLISSLSGLPGQKNGQKATRGPSQP